MHGKVERERILQFAAAFNIAQQTHTYRLNGNRERERERKKIIIFYAYDVIEASICIFFSNIIFI